MITHNWHINALCFMIIAGVKLSCGVCKRATEFTYHTAAGNLTHVVSNTKFSQVQNDRRETTLEK